MKIQSIFRRIGYHPPMNYGKTLPGTRHLAKEIIEKESFYENSPRH